MIRKLLKLQNIGLFLDATPNGPIDLARITLVYAENGRGKTTLATTMRACSRGEAGRVDARRTIDSPDLPDISFLVQEDNQNGQVKYTNGAWCGSSPLIVVFDSEFVDQHVYSGSEVRTDQRQSLLEFALGEQMVQLKQRVDQLTQDIETQTKRRTQAEKTLSGYALPHTVTQFIALQQVPNAQKQIDALQKRIEAAKNAQQLAARQIPSALPLIVFDVPAVFGILKKRLKDVEQSAEAVVRGHLAKHGGAGMEDWVSHGQDYASLEECPFCGQSLRGLELIRAYRSYFNEAYSDLKREVAGLAAQVAAGLADSRIEALDAAVATNTARIEAWKDQLDLTPPTLPTDQLRLALKQVREQLITLVSTKRQTPLEAVGSQVECDATTSAVASISQTIITYNSELGMLARTIAHFKKTLAEEEIETLQAEIKKLEAVQKRQLPDVIAAIGEYQTAEAERKRLENEKTQAREQIDTLMQTTLQQFQAGINQLLASFGAEFSIEQLKPSYIGSGEPRTEYALSIRNRSVKLGSRADLAGAHSFATTLSEGDKRTLAFAFFIARLKADANLADKVVVLDDPVASLDRNRRHESLRVISDLATKSRQLIVLSHDPYFVRDLRERLGELKPTPLTAALLTIKRVQNGYSAFASCDIDDVCSSDYYRHHRLVGDYVDGKSTTNARDVAKAIRPMLEGYYHRRFPRRIPRRMLFGQIISEAQQAGPKDPLSHLKPILKELIEVNDYAGKFHHDVNLASETASVNETELLRYARRALNLIYQNG